MSYIERGPLLADMMRYLERRKEVGDQKGASVARECYKIAARQPIVVGEWEDDVCSVCLTNVEGAMEHKWLWCPKCGAKMKEVDDGNR